MAAQHYTIVSASVALTNSLSAYTAGDVVGGLLTIPTRSGTLRNIKLTDDDNEGAALTLYLFNAAPTAIVDADPFATSFVKADHDKLLRVLTLAADEYTTINSNKSGWFANADGQIDHAIDFHAPDNNLYAYLVCDATPTLAALAYTLRFTIWQVNSSPAV